MLTPAQKHALDRVAERFGWDKMSVEELGHLVWALFHYYVTRLKV